MPPDTKRPPLEPVTKAWRAVPGYAELHAKTNFSFLQGASHADELAQAAAELGLAALAVTDRNTLAGVVRAHTAAKQVELRLVIGAELDLLDAPTVVLWPTDRASYGRLSRLITLGHRQAPKGEFHLTFDQLAAHSDGLLAGVLARVGNPQDEEVGIGARDWGLGTREEENEEGVRGWGLGVGDESKEDQEIATGSDRPRLRLFSSLTPDPQPLTPDFFRPPAPRPQALVPSLLRFRELFGDRAYLVAELAKGADDAEALARLVALGKESGLPLVAAGDVHYHARSRLALQDVLTAIRLGTTVAEAGERLFPNAERYLKSPAEMAARFAAAPDAIARTLEIVERSTFSLDELRYEYPEELAPAGMTPLEYLTRMTWKGAHKRYPAGIPEKVRGLIEHELALIAELRYEAYFLTVFDMVRFARRRGILCQGRGSAANSAVCYVLGVTAVDPQHVDLLFERFVSRERNEAPDIDVDFEHERREEVLQYLYDKYGRERAGMTAEVISYRPRSAVRDVGKALGLSLDQVDALTKTLEGHGLDGRLAARCRDSGVDPDSFLGQRLIGLVGELVGFPRHLGQHVGGMVMTQGPLCEMVPIENAAMEGRTVIEWNKDDLDELGILKVDCLSLGMLTAIRKCFALVKEHSGRALTLANVPQDDPQVYRMISRADTMGVFQIESRAQMSMLPRLRPRTFYDLVIEVAIVRPGPIQGNMVHPYLRRRAGEEEVTYPNDEIREVLSKTLGVPLFQEQAMRLAVVAAGFTPGEADQLRRAMGAWRRPGIIEQFRQKLLDGMQAKGLSRAFAENVFNQIRGFGEYGFPESHAASFALLVYISSWLKHYYAAAFTAALINSQPMGFYAPAQLVRNACEHGVEILPIDVNASAWDCTLEGRRQATGHRPQVGVGDWGLGVREDNPFPLAGAGGARGSTELAEVSEPSEGWSASEGSFPAAGLSSPTPNPQPLTPPLGLRLGLRMIGGLSETHVRVIEEARAAGAFRGWADFARRTRLSGAVMARLAAADAFASLDLDRRGALWQALAEEKKPLALPLFDSLAADDEPPAVLPKLEPREEVLADYRTAGLSLRAHPIEFERKRLNALGVLPSKRLTTHPANRMVRVAGIVLVRQRPSTAKGITFVTLEDETGVANLIIRQDVWQKFYRVARTSAAMIATGRLQRHGRVIHVLVTRLEDMSQSLRGLGSQSRDFH
jgi:error-prone DNA polymerase